MPLDVLNIIEFGSERVRNIDHDDFPIGLAFIEECHDAENFNLFDLTNVADLFANLANVKWVIVTLSLGLGV